MESIGGPCLQGSGQSILVQRLGCGIGVCNDGQVGNVRHSCSIPVGLKLGGDRRLMGGLFCEFVVFGLVVRAGLGKGLFFEFATWNFVSDGGTTHGH